jgi:hypothetical protein
VNFLERKVEVESLGRVGLLASNGEKGMPWIACGDGVFRWY